MRKSPPLWILVLLSGIGCTAMQSDFAPSPGAGAAAAAAFRQLDEPPAEEPATLEEVPAAPSADLLWRYLPELEQLELSFVDPDSLEVFGASGPFTPIYWDENTLELVGRDKYGLGRALVTLRSDATGTWAHTRVRDREFLIRLP